MKVLIVQADGTEHGVLGGAETEAWYADAAIFYGAVLDVNGELDLLPDEIRFNRYRGTVAMTWLHADGDTTAVLPYDGVRALMVQS